MQNKKYLTQMLDQYLENESESASDEVIRSRNKFHEAIDQYVADVFEDAWMKGFAYALRIQAGKQ